MSRPKKDGVEYFSVDVDFFEDDKIKLLRAEFGAKGVYILMYLLCQIYKNGYYISWNDDKCLLVSDGAGCGCTPGFVQEFINGCFKRSFFDKGVFEMFGILTSRGIQRRFLYAVMTRPEIRVIQEYFLLDDEFEELPKGIQQKIIFKSVNSKETPVNLKETPVNLKNMPQSKVKESKVKESKADTMSASADTRSPSIDYKQIVDLFNEICTSLPRVQNISDKRKKQIKNIVKQFSPDFKEVFEKVEKSDFLTGRNGKWTNCGFDWIFNPSNFVKIIEGNYDNNEKNQNRQNNLPTERNYYEEW